MDAKVIVSFLAGVAVGAAAGIFYMRRSVDEIVAEEVESVKESYRQKEEEENTDFSEVPTADHEVNIGLKEAYEKIVEEEGYGEVEAKEESNYILMDNDIYIRDQEKFDGYDLKTLLYTTDGYVVDDETKKALATDAQLAAIDMNIIEVARKFKEYDDDVFYVANRIEKCIYEVLLTNKEYKEE